MKISISTKLISVTILILVSASLSITWISSEYFEKKSAEQVDIANLESAVSKAKELDAIVARIIDKIQILSAILLKSPNNYSGNREFIEAFSKEKNFAAIEIFKINESSVEITHRKLNDDLYRSFNLGESHLDKVRDSQSFPLMSVAQGQIVIRNGSLPRAPAQISIGIPIARNQVGQITHIAIAEIKLENFEKVFSEPSEKIHYLIDPNGELIAHKDELKAISRWNMSKQPFVQKALNQKTPQFQTKFKESESDKNYFGAAVKSSFGLIVISETSEDVILEVSREIKRRAIFVAGSAISFSIFFIFLFSITLTSPIERLAGLIKDVSQGNFDVHAQEQVRSSDEVGDLAIAFDNMTQGLKERDKVKTLFSKFHGSSIAEDIISKDIVVGGQSKEVVILFCDIRSFTSFSENKSPEEVVAMLNEYFSVMVKVINQHGGVVDKFIGDAIMAVWGAPQSTPFDVYNSVKACLEMRKTLAELNSRRLARNAPPIVIGIGLHTGTAISGTIGSTERMEYTVIGNTVNTASRIESSTKAFGTDLLVSEAVFLKLGDSFKTEFAGSAEVKGRSEALNLFKVRGFRTQSGEYVEVVTPYSDYEPESSEKVKTS
jgi:adenylate cyclase